MCAQVNPEGKYVVDLDKNIDILEIKPNLRVALRNDSYVLHKVRNLSDWNKRFFDCKSLVRA